MNARPEAAGRAGGARPFAAHEWGIAWAWMRAIPWVAEPEAAFGDLERLPEGVAIGDGVARELGVRAAGWLRT